MGNGMVRKVDELGRVVIPKEMRRILNIKTGSSIEMFINDQNQVVLKKFSELENVSSIIDTLTKIIYESFSVACFICDDEKVLCVCGLSKKEFLQKKVNFNLVQDKFFKTELCQILSDVESNKNCSVFSILCEGFENGKLVDCDDINEEKKQSIEILLKFLCELLVF